MMAAARLDTSSTAENYFLPFNHWQRFYSDRMNIDLSVIPLESSVLQSPVFTKQPGSIVYPVETLEKNREVVFSCEAQGSPPPIYRWKLNGTEISPKSGSHYSLSGGNLRISHLNKDQDAGTYQCLASNSFGTIVSREASLTFAYLENFRTHRRSSVSVREGQGVVLLCGSPPHSGDLIFSWIFNEYPTFVKQDTRRFISQETGNLYIAKVEPSDVGNYTCVVTNTVTKTRVQGPPTPLVLRSDGVMGEYEPKIEVQFPEVVHVAKGSTVKLECFALGNPVPSISWRRVDGVPFPRKVDMRKASGVLEIPYFQQEDAGTYECVAENSRGMNTVKGKLSFYAPPHLIEKPQDVQKLIDDSLVWECKATGKPKPSFRWMKNGENLEPAEERIQVGNGALSISRLTLLDTGMYQCVAGNKHGEVYSNAELRVIDFSHNQLRSQTLVKVGGDVLIECKPKMSPWGVISWRKGSEPLQESNSCRYTEVSLLLSMFDGNVDIAGLWVSILENGNLRIWNATKSDASLYTCVARNQFGVASSTGSVMVKEPTIITTLPSTLDVTVGESVVLPCQVSHDPSLELKFTWFFNEQLIHFGSHGGFFEKVGGPVPEELQNGPGFGYVVAFRPHGATGWMQAAVPSAEASRYVFKNESIQPFSPFHVKVGVYNNEGEGPFGPVTTIYSAEEEPGRAPTRVRAKSLSASEIDVSWKALPWNASKKRVLGYELRYWSRSEREDTASVQRTVGNQTSTIIHGVKGSTTYYISVRAYNTAGTGPPSSTVNVTTKKPPPSQPPVKVMWNTSNSKIILNWEQVKALENESEVTGYKVLYKKNRHSRPNVMETNTTSVELALPTDEDYIIQIKPFGEGGEGSSSRQITIPRVPGSGRGGAGILCVNAEVTESPDAMWDCCGTEVQCNLTNKCFHLIEDSVPVKKDFPFAALDVTSFT
ncbi:hypothetical protein PAMP_017809 [Pampus punctatissimus]